MRVGKLCCRESVSNLTSFLSDEKLDKIKWKQYQILSHHKTFSLTHTHYRNDSYRLG